MKCLNFKLKFKPFTNLNITIAISGKMKLKSKPLVHFKTDNIGFYIYSMKFCLFIYLFVKHVGT